MDAPLLLIGTHRRAHHADAVDAAFGIYAARSAGEARLVAETPQPGWIATHPRLPVVYAVNEVKVLAGADGGSVSAFLREADGGLRPLGSRPTPPAPCHCSVDATGRFLVVATFGGGSVNLFPIADDGSLLAQADSHRHRGSSVHPRRQTHPHAHAAVIDPSNRFVLVPDLGTDRLLVYGLDPVGARLIPRPELTAILPPASGPRHLAFDAAGSFAYLANEMSATVAVFAFEEGRLEPIETADLLPSGFVGLRSGAAILIAGSGRFLYATTRSHGSSGMPAEPGLDALVWFAIDPGSGRLSLAGRVASGGEIPRAALLGDDGTRLLVAHQGSGLVTEFDLDPRTGTPSRTDNDRRVPVPVCLCWAPPSVSP